MPTIVEKTRSLHRGKRGDREQKWIEPANSWGKTGEGSDSPVSFEPAQCMYAQSACTMSPVNFKQTIEDHQVSKLKNTTAKRCTFNCNNITMQELWESFFIKACLEDPILTTSIINVNRKIFKALETKMPDQYKKLVDQWLRKESIFPVNQKDREWDLGLKYMLMDYVGIDHDPTSVPLSGDFMKFLAENIVDPLVKFERDSYYNEVIQPLNGFRRIVFRKNPDSGDNIKETQVGLAKFDFDRLTLDGRYYQSKPWVHPGMSRCDLSSDQSYEVMSAYQREVDRLSIPMACGISGSTNYWLWTGLFAQVDFTVEEMCLFILSAYLTLGSDGGHTLLEVLSSATLLAIYWKSYLNHFSISKGEKPLPSYVLELDWKSNLEGGILPDEREGNDARLMPYLRESTFAETLFEVTKNINPIGTPVNQLDAEIESTDTAHMLFTEGWEKYLQGIDFPKVRKRGRLERFFGRGRFELPFARYQDFFNFMPKLNRIRKKVVEQLQEYVNETCNCKE